MGEFLCGRYSLTRSYSEIILKFEIVDTGEPDLSARYNIAPTQLAPVILNKTNNTPPTLQFMNWGMVAPWSKEFKMTFATINARSENIESSRLYQTPYKSQRCLVPADGYYEWKVEGNKKQPLWFHLENQSLFAMAGIYEVWRVNQQKVKHSFSILTTNANAFVSQFHDRMPVLLDSNSAIRWLDKKTSQEELRNLCKPWLGDSLKVVRANPKMNSVKYEGPDCLAEVVW